MYHVSSATVLAVGTRFLSTRNQYFSTNFFLVESNRILRQLSRGGVRWALAYLVSNTIGFTIYIFFIHSSNFPGFGNQFFRS